MTTFYVFLYLVQSVLPGTAWEMSQPDRTPDVRESIEKLKTDFGFKPGELAIVIDPERQELYLIRDEQILRTYLISTGEAGIGSKKGSRMTPVGTHRIAEKIGDGAPIGASFKGREPTGFIRPIFSTETNFPWDSILTRILWLDGQENGVNRGGDVDSYSRYIYIHGTQKEWMLGRPSSNGCIKMRNADLIELFNLIPLNTLVEIQNRNYRPVRLKCLHFFID